MASLFTPFNTSMSPQGIVQGQFGSNLQGGQLGQGQGNLMSIIELIKRLQQGPQGNQEDELTRQLEAIRKATQVTGSF